MIMSNSFVKAEGLDYSLQDVLDASSKFSTKQLISRMSSAHAAAVLGDAAAMAARTTCDLYQEPCSRTFTLGGGPDSPAATSVCAPCMPASNATGGRSKW